MSQWTVEEKDLALHPDSSYKWERLEKFPDANVPMGANFATPAADMLYFDQGGIHMITTGVDKNNGAAVLQGSLDGVNWSDLPLTLKGISVGSDVLLWDVSDLGVRFVRVSYTANTVTAGTANFRYLFKSRK
jgi:hypothetical protein